MKSRITINPVILPHAKRRDGTYNVKIRITYKRVSKILPTQITALPADITKTKPPHLKSNSAALLRALEITKDMYKIVNEMGYNTLEYMDVATVTEYISKAYIKVNEPFSLDFFEFAEQYMAGLNIGTAHVTENALSAFKRFLGTDRLEITSITGSTVRAFYDFLSSERRFANREIPESKKAESKKAITISQYISRIQTIYRAAQDLYNDEDAGVINIPRNPFKNRPLPAAPEPRHRALDAELIQKIIGFDGECSQNERLALDLFVISFGLMGMNLADLAEAEPPSGDVIVYERKKTRGRRADRARIEVKVDPRLLPYIERAREPKGKMWLKVHCSGSAATAPSAQVNYYLSTWAAKQGIDRFTFYAARHSFATIARNELGIDKGTIDECLDHAGATPLADVYIKRDFKRLWEVNRKVLDLFDWPGSGD